MKNFTLIFFVFFCCCKVSYSQAGKLDSSFGTNGIVKTDFGFTNDINYATTGGQVMLQKDGKLYVLIESSGQSYIAKRLQNGSPDVSYGNNGFSEPIDIEKAVAVIQPDGEIAIAGNDHGNNFAVARFNTDGTVDNAFLQKKTTDFGSGYNIANAIAVQSDGKIVVAGYALVGSNIHFAVARYNTDGTADNNFSDDGKQTTDFGSEVNYGYSIALQNDGKIVVAGQTYGNSFSDFAIARYNNDGSLDNSFSEDGKQTTDFNSSDDIGKAVSIQNDGKIVIAGYQYKCNDATCSDAQFALARYNTNGTLDNTFSEDGKQITSSRGGYYATSLVIQSDGRIVVGGYTFEGGNADFAFARINTNGSLDNTFNAGGRLTTDVNGDDFAYSIAIQTDGKIVAAGMDYGDNFDVVRFYTDGRLDDTFGRSGKLIDKLRLNQGSTYYTSTAVQKDGKLVTAGYTWNGSNYDFALARYNLDGTPDNSFSQDGRQTTGFGTSDDYAYAVAIQTDGKIVLAGVAGPNFAVTRYNIDGSLDKGFGTGGKKITDFGTDRSASATSVALQADGKIVVGGYTDPSQHQNEDFALARYNTDGTPDSSFSNDGKLTTDLGFSDFANSLVIQKDGKIVVAGYSSIDTRGYSSSFFALTRYNVDGTPDGSFSEDGKQFTTFDLFSSAQSVSIQNDGKIVAAGFSSSSSRKGEDFALARYNTDGSLDNTFNNDGTKIADLGSVSENISSVAIQNDGKILTAGSSEANFALARFSSDGSFDNSFGDHGKVITQASGQEDVINDIAISNNKAYAVGYGQYPGSLGVIARYVLDEMKTPSISLTIPYNIVKYAGPARIKLNADVANVNGTINKVRFYNGTTLLHTEDVFPYGFLWLDVPVGNYNLTAKAYDDGGSVTTSNSITVLVVDSNVAPVVSIADPVSDTTYTGPATIRLIANAKDPNDKISKVEFYNGLILLRTEYNYPYTYTWSNVQPGTYTITAKATDDKGLSTTSSHITVTVLSNRLLADRSVSINNGIDMISLKLSPNPAKNFLQVSANGLEENRATTISVISASGIEQKVVPLNTSSKVIELNVGSLTSGVYTVKVVNGDNVIYRKFVKL
ncbi:Ig-like domain-containing protein [Segetibacter koreensis]|uniref:Ig-like domain-containing protein n=1 Tax=Segetibacter koreensis TaxID=398037 RepID=UPI00036B653D|nr:Ig-like domain-containing protein [Segetibacter koreensis]